MLAPHAIFGQVGMPDATPPEPGGLWDSIMGPLLPLLSNAWYVVIHYLCPLFLLAGLLAYGWMALRGNRAGMNQARGVIFAVPIALFYVSIAVLISNWVIGHYA